MDTLDEVVRAIQKAQAVDRVNKKETESFRLFLQRTSAEDLARLRDDVPSGAQGTLEFLHQKLCWPQLAPDYADTVDASIKQCKEWQAASESAGQKGMHTATFFLSETDHGSVHVGPVQGQERAEVFRTLCNEADHFGVRRQVLKENFLDMDDKWTKFDKACVAAHEEISAARQENLAHGDATQRELDTMCSTANKEERDYACAVENEHTVRLALDGKLREVQGLLRALEGAIKGTADAELSVLVSRTIVPHAQACLRDEIIAVDEREKGLLADTEEVQARRTQGGGQHEIDRQQIFQAVEKLRLAEYEKLCRADRLAVATLSESVCEVEFARMKRDKHKRELDASRRTLSRVTPDDWAVKTQVTKEITNLLLEEQNAEHNLEALQRGRKVWEDNCSVATGHKSGLEQALFSLDCEAGFSYDFETVEKESQIWVEQFFPPVDARAIQVLREFDNEETARDGTLHTIAQELRALRNRVQDVEENTVLKGHIDEEHFDESVRAQEHVADDNLIEGPVDDDEEQTKEEPPSDKEDETPNANEYEPPSESDEEPTSENEENTQINGRTEDSKEWCVIADAKLSAEKKKIDDFLKPRDAKKNADGLHHACHTEMRAGPSEFEATNCPAANWRNEEKKWVRECAREQAGERAETLFSSRKSGRAADLCLGSGSP
eukprot:GEMP01011696.1.p1 GENE.GEMP01011696.1~~GEMP01011696.1.p1  ORF type:complete len:668 (+),score=188.42 GEMP01011696.1:26-2029(+)